MTKSTLTTRLVVCLLTLAIAGSGPAFAGNEKPAPEKSAGAVATQMDKDNQDAIKGHVQTQNKLIENINKGVTEGLTKTVEALRLIRNNKKQEAIKALEAATGKFDIALGVNPSIGLIPVDASIVATELNMAPDDVKKQVDLARKLLKDYKVQAARIVLQPLRDDLVTKIVSLPMSTYPDAIKLATKMLNEGNSDAAVNILETALSTFVEKVSVIPLPLIRVEAMIRVASELDKEKGKEKALKLLDQAQKQLELATILGYTDKDSVAYEDLAAQMKALNKEAKGKNFVEKMYDKLNNSIKELMNRSSEPTELKKQEQADEKQ